jgi:REP element-mobilizing transposase RayT
MPRKARLIVPGAVYHVMGRCLDQYKLFYDDADRSHFLLLLDICLRRTDTCCYAWVLMDNHFHFVLRIGDCELWEIMKPLNMRYSQYHKVKTHRRGPLFMDRYKSIVTQDQDYVQELVRYVHLNPVRAGICKDLSALNSYPWSGHSAMMGKCKREFQDVHTILRRFGRTDNEARDAYCRFLSDGIKETGTDTLVDLVRKSNTGLESGRKATCWVIGDQKFVKRVTDSAQARRLRISRLERDGATCEIIAEKIAVQFKISVEILKRRQRGGSGSEARKTFAFVAAKEFGAPLKIIGEYLNVGSAAISAMIHSGREVCKKRKIAI